MMKQTIQTYSPPVLTLAAIVALWELVTRAFNVPTFLLPAPSVVVGQLWEWRGTLPMHTWTTLYESLLGFALGIIGGVPLAVLIVYSRFLQNTIYPILLVAQSVPKVAIAPLFLIWLGYGEAPKVLISFLVCFFPIVVDTATGMNTVPPELLDLVHSLSNDKLQVFVKVRIPSALPHFFSSLKVAITLAVIGAVIGEFVGSDRGLGYLILVASAWLNTGLVFGGIVILALMGIVLFALVSLAEKLLCPWYVSTD